MRRRTSRRRTSAAPRPRRRRRTSLRRNDLYQDWDRVSYARRVAEKSGDARAIEVARDNERQVYNLMQAERSRRTRRNPGSGKPTGLMEPPERDDPSERDEWLVKVGRVNDVDFVASIAGSSYQLVRGPWTALDFGSQVAAVRFARSIKKQTQVVRGRFTPDGYEVHIVDDLEPNSSAASDLQAKYQKEVARYKLKRAAEQDLAGRIDAYSPPCFQGEVISVPSRSRPGQESYAVMLWPTKRYEKAWISSERIYNEEEEERHQARKIDRYS